ncbi:MAG TPA: ATP-binding protein [Spirochaetota bacterium]|nr:ATP-binding protein [Spirochaetota bacterium]HNT09802.1 ATP-binding protein [Spirochaetota bacterium]
MNAIYKNAVVLPNNCKDLYSFEEVLSRTVSLADVRPDALDLSRISFIEPYSMLNLLLVGRNYLRATGDRLALINMPLTVHQYLARMDFLKKGVFTVPEPLDEELFLKRSSFSKTVIEITDIPNKERESLQAISAVVALFRTRANHILKYWIANSIVDYFVTVISEICQNIFEHSLDSGYCAMQTYASGSEHIVRLAIVDSGIGIRESFARNKEIEFESSAKLIEQALMTPISSKRPFGYGLCQVNTLMEKLKGSIFIRSENASIAVMYNRKHERKPYTFMRNDLAAFPGTQLSISLSG